MNSRRRLAIFAMLLIALALPGCAWWGGKKSSSEIVSGEGSNIIYQNPESAGGRIGGRE